MAAHERTSMHALTFPRVSTSSTAVIATVAASCALIVLAHPGWYGFAAASTCAIAATAALVDIRTLRLPDHLVVLAALPSVLAALVGGVPGDAALGALVLAGPIILVHVVAPTAMGFGDVKLAAALGIAIGLFDPAWSLIALCVASGVTATVGLTRRVSSLPFGPGLVVGAVVAMILSGVFPNGFAEGRLPWR